MRKLRSVRQAFLDCPLAIAPEALLTFAEKGAIASWRGPDNRAYRLEYTANVVITDYAGAAEDLFFVALDWLERECPDADETAIRFHVDVIDHRKADVSIALDIGEVVAGKIETDGLHLAAVADPDADSLSMANLHPGLPPASSI